LVCTGSVPTPGPAALFLLYSFIPSVPTWCMEDLLYPSVPCISCLLLPCSLSPSEWYLYLYFLLVRSEDSNIYPTPFSANVSIAYRSPAVWSDVLPCAVGCPIQKACMCFCHVWIYFYFYVCPWRVGGGVLPMGYLYYSSSGSLPFITALYCL